MAQRTQDFQTIRSEGGVLPSDLLRRVLDPKLKLDGTRPEDYGLPQGERLNEVITQSRNRLRKHWAEFRAAAAHLPDGEPGTGLTNDRWSLPLLRELGFGLLPTSAGLRLTAVPTPSAASLARCRCIWSAAACRSIAAPPACVAPLPPTRTGWCRSW